MLGILKASSNGMGAKRPQLGVHFAPLALAAVSTVRLVNPCSPLSVCVRVALAAGLCAAAPARAGLAPEAVAQALTLATQAAQALAPRGARIQVEAGQLDARLNLAPCTTVQVFLPAGSSPWGRGRVGLRCMQGAVAWQVFLPVTVHVWATAVVASTALPAGARLDPSQLGLAEVDWAASSSAPVATLQAAQERVLNRPLLAGQALRGSDLRARQWFALGETVRIVAQGRGFAVSAEGLAMGPGVEGQPVRVRTDAGRVLVGLPTAQRLVELKL